MENVGDREGAAAREPHDDLGAKTQDSGATGLQGSVQRVIDEALRPSTIVAGIALWIYATLRIAYEAFYRPLGLSPDDLGLGYAELLAQSAIGVVAMAIFSAFYVFNVATLPFVHERRLRELTIEQRKNATTFVALAALAAFFATQLVIPAELEDNSMLLFTTASSIALLVYASFRLTILTWQPRYATDDTARLALAGVTVLVFASALVILSAARDSERVRDGKARLGGAALLTSWGADVATVSWTTDNLEGNVRGLARDCMLYLGHANNTVFLVRPDGERTKTFRIPAANVAVELHPSKSACDLVQ